MWDRGWIRGSRPTSRCSRPTITFRWPSTSSTSASPRPQGSGAAGHERRRRLGARHGWELGTRARFIEVLTMYDPVSGPLSDVEARLAGSVRGRDQGAGLPELGPGPVRLAGQGDPGALLSHLQRAPRRGAGALRQPHLWGRADQLVGCRRSPADPPGDEGARTETFLMPLSPGKDDDGKPIDFASIAMAACGRRSKTSRCRCRTTSVRARRRRQTSSTLSCVSMLHYVAPSGICSAVTCSAAFSTATPACGSDGSKGASTGCPRRCRTPST